MASPVKSTKHLRVNIILPHTLPTKSKRVEYFQNLFTTVAFILILKPVKNYVRERTNLRSSGHTHVVQNNLWLQMPHLGFSYGLSGLNSGPLDCHDNIQLIDIALSPQRLPSQFFHFVVLFLNPQSILIKSQKKTKLLQKKSYKEGRLFNT